MVLLINNLGALSVLELGAIVTEVVVQLEQHHHVKAVRVFAGTFMTSLDGPGFSISLLNVFDTGFDKGLLELLNAPSNVAGWHPGAKVEAASRHRNRELEAPEPKSVACTECKLQCDMNGVVNRLQAGLKSVIAAEPEITKYDDVVGDGDCGTTLRRGAEGESILQLRAFGRQAH